jgi:hypothetical protein
MTTFPFEYHVVRAIRRGFRVELSFQRRNVKSEAWTALAVCDEMPDMCEVQVLLQAYLKANNEK